MSAPTSPFQDAIAGVLSAQPNLTDQNRSDIWEAYHQSKDLNELAQHLQMMDIPDSVKHTIWMTKASTVPKQSPVDKVAAAIQAMMRLDPKQMEIAEKNPRTLQAFLKG